MSDGESGPEIPQQEPVRVNKKIAAVADNIVGMHTSGNSGETPNFDADLATRTNMLERMGVHPSWYSQEELSFEDDVEPWVVTRSKALEANSHESTKKKARKFDKGADLSKPIDSTPNIELIVDMSDANLGFRRENRKDKRVKAEEKARLEAEEATRLAEEERLRLEREKLHRRKMEVMDRIRQTKKRRDELMKQHKKLVEERERARKVEEAKSDGESAGKKHASLFYTERGRAETEEFLDEWVSAAKQGLFEGKKVTQGRVLQELDGLSANDWSSANTALGRKKLEEIEIDDRIL